MDLLADLRFTFYLVRIEVVLKLLYSVAKETLVKAAKLDTKILGYQTDCSGTYSFPGIHRIHGLSTLTADVASRKQYSKHH